MENLQPFLLKTFQLDRTKCLKIARCVPRALSNLLSAVPERGATAPTRRLLGWARRCSPAAGGRTGRAGGGSCLQPAAGAGKPAQVNYPP